jgi:hypothetical protein
LHKPKGVDREAALTLGFVSLTSWLVRCDVLEWLLAGEPSELGSAVMQRFGLDEERARALVRELPSRKKRRRRR